MPLTNDRIPGQEGDLFRGRDYTPILVGDTPVAHDYHLFMMDNSQTKQPAQPSLFPLPLKTGNNPPKQSAWKRRVTRTHNGRPPAGESKPASTEKPKSGS